MLCHLYCFKYTKGKVEKGKPVLYITTARIQWTTSTKCLHFLPPCAGLLIIPAIPWFQMSLWLEHCQLRERSIG